MEIVRTISNIRTYSAIEIFPAWDSIYSLESHEQLEWELLEIFTSIKEKPNNENSFENKLNFFKNKINSFEDKIYFFVRNVELIVLT